MHLIDWLLVIIPVLGVCWISFYTRRYLRNVADFMAGGRCAGRYLICNAKGEATSGVANTMSKFQMIIISGFVLAFWEKISIPVMLLVGISGFIVFRYRETRALTLGQFFENRYSRRFRLFMGFLGFIAGILNYGVFPAIGARFFVYFLGLAPVTHLLGWPIDTYIIIMAIYLPISFLMIMFGGQITLLVSDCIEGIISHLIYMIVIIALLVVVSWDQIVAVTSNMPAEQSMLNPFDAGKVADFNIWFILMSMVLGVYTTMAWQGGHGFNSAARTPHEARMGNVLGNWRTYARALVILVCGICAWTFLKHPDFADQAGGVWQKLNLISNSKIRNEATVPMALAALLPIGVKGLFCLVMVLGLFAGDGNHMQSWGSILIQDVIMPFRKKPLTPRQHIGLLRWSVAGVGVFAFFFSALFTQSHYISMWWMITGGVFTAGAGSAIIGGLYWKRGTAAGAWAAVITGAILSAGGIMLHQFWGSIYAGFGPGTHYGWNLPVEFWLNGLWVNVVASGAAIACYVVVSLATCRQPFNLDRLLHRGQYAVEPNSSAIETTPAGWRQRLRLSRLLGFDEHFTFRDKLVAGGIFWWSMLLLGLNMVISIWNLWIKPWPTSWWANYWMITGIALPFVIAVVTLVWFSIGGFIDLRDFFHSLRTMTRDATDDGRADVRIDAAGVPIRPSSAMASDVKEVTVITTTATLPPVAVTPQ